jgi:hypothetical protein
MPGGLVKVLAQSTIRAQIECVYGTKEQALPSEGAEKGQGRENCTKAELQKTALVTPLRASDRGDGFSGI